MFHFNQDTRLGCLVGGLIGDATGALFENQIPAPPQQALDFTAYAWQTTDDTQLTLATLESIVAHQGAYPEKIAANFLTWHQQRRLTGLGSATLQALRGLQVGGHWALVGRSGEFAAGNGAAMRVAPLAFLPNIDQNRMLIKDVCTITHKNDEAYIGTLTVVLALQAIASNPDLPPSDLYNYLLAQLPDTKVRDGLKLASQLGNMSVEMFAQHFGNSGYVAETVPLAVFAAIQAITLGFEPMIKAIIKAGGDTDTIGSIAGQLAGARLGLAGLPLHLIKKARQLPEFNAFEQLACSD